MAKKKATSETKDVTMSMEKLFPDSPIIRLVPMPGYVQYFFENGVNGSVKHQAEIDYLQKRWKQDRDARKAVADESGGE